MITVSIVSHGHGDMVNRLVKQLLQYPEVTSVIVTRNIADTSDLLSDERVSVIDNPLPMGFGENHNKAFRQVRSPYFLVLNPDVCFLDNPFSVLLNSFSDEAVAVCAPSIVSPVGLIEDHVRQFPSPRGLIRKLWGYDDSRVDYAPDSPPLAVPWVAGMFMLFRTDAFRDIGGFDEGYFLYYEDVDVCVRLWRDNRKVILVPRVSVAHDARRASRRSFQYMRWHAASMTRYFLKHWGRLPRVA